MISLRSLVAAGAVCLTCAGCGGGAAATPKPTTPTTKAASDGGAEAFTARKILHKKDVPEMPGKESIIYLGMIPTGGASGRHTHPGPELAYVVSGKVTLEKDGEEPRSVNAGETFSTQAKKIHDVKNAGSEPAKIVVFILMDKGAELSTPAN